MEFIAGILRHGAIPLLERLAQTRRGFRLLVGNFLGSERAPVRFDTEGEVRTIAAGRAILGSIEPIAGAEPGKPVTIENSTYWMGPTIKVARGLKSRVRSHGRVWNFDDCSAELCDIAWKG